MTESFKQISERLLTSSNYEEVDEVEWDIQNLVKIHDKVEKENAELKRKLDLAVGALEKLGHYGIDFGCGKFECNVAGVAQEALKQIEELK